MLEIVLVKFWNSWSLGTLKLSGGDIFESISLALRNKNKVEDINLSY